MSFSLHMLNSKLSGLVVRAEDTCTKGHGFESNNIVVYFLQIVELANILCMQLKTQAINCQVFTPATFDLKSLMVGRKKSTIFTRHLSPASVESCPGVCVAERLSGFCEAILNIDGICKPDLKCCVSKQLFNGKIPPGIGTHSYPFL